MVALSSVTHLAPAGVPQPGPLTHLATSRHSLHGNLGSRDHQCRLPDVTQVGGRWLAGVLGPSGGQGKGGGGEWYQETREKGKVHEHTLVPYGGFLNANDKSLEVCGS